MMSCCECYRDGVIRVGLGYQCMYCNARWDLDDNK